MLENFKKFFGAFIGLGCGCITFLFVIAFIIFLLLVFINYIGV